jgi:FKBP-type peptidyl-prolyl cis-trans isomerase FklB
MKKILFMLLLVNSSIAMLAQPGKKVAKPTPKPTAAFLKNLQDSASYALGYNVGQNIAQRYKDLNVEILNRAIKDALTKKASIMDPNLTNQCMNNYMALQRGKSSEVAKKAGDKFLAENKKRAGVVTTASGLQYEILTQGTGAKPVSSDMVKVHYEGRLLNGTVFDASLKHGTEPASFGVGGVIAGWTEVLQLMPVGSKYRVYVPSNLAYGDYGAGESIGPGETLIFDIDLLEIVKGMNQKEQQPEAKPSEQ